MATQRKLIDDLISSGVQPEPVPVKQPEQEPFVIPATQATVTPPFPIPPEETFTYPTTNLPYTYPPNPPFFPTHIRVPEGFKTHKFNKYDGTGNPKTHLRLFANKLGKPVDDENLSLRLFPESLEGDALDWYSNLKPEEVKTWIDLSNAFVRQVGKIVNVSTLKSQLDALQGQGSSGKKPQFKKKEGEAAFIWDQNPIPRPRFQRQPTYSPYPYYPRAPGHSTANCRLLKHRVQDMLEAGEIVIRKREEQGPNVSKNPLPEHTDTVGVIMDDEEFEEFVRSVSNKTEVFGIMDQPFVIDEASYEEDKKPFILDLTPSESAALEPVVIEFPEQVPVLSLRQVPWNYSESVLQIGGKPVLKEEVSAVMKSGRITSPSAASAPVQGSNCESTTKPAVTEKEAWDFLKRLKRSEYNVVEQLNKMPAQIFILHLLFTSDLHRDALLEVLTKARIPKDISVDNLSHIVGNILTSKQITFSDEELPAEGTGHNKALYVAVRCNGRMLPKVLIDNGSALNICPWSTLVKLGLQDVKLKPSETVVRGFDGAQRESLGEVNLVVEMGPAQFQIACQVMHFPSVYNVLIGQPWIHSSGAVPSSLHQVLKFVVNNQLITIFAEENCIVIADSEPEEDGNRNALVSSYRTADIVSVSWIMSEGSKDERILPAASVMMAKEMIRGRYEFDKGLGRNLQGLLKPVELIEKDQFGLEFRPTARDI
ncbi:uncharacterized protein [Coffea arabica]|uniref:Retrotransposon gag domain-containing protein n=1 Tax=Coffea arabica TaxID=13443 RepID=A0ABM4VM55_COFAR